MIEQKYGSGDEEDTLFPEHSFLLSCFKLGLNYNDLKYLTYLDILKMFLSLSNSKPNNKIKNATQEDIDKLLG